MSAYYYLMYAFLRYAGFTSGGLLGRFQAHVALLWVQGSIINCAIYAVFFEKIQSANILLIGFISTVALAPLNAYIFSDKNEKWKSYENRFLTMPITKIKIADVFSGVFFLFAIFLLPIFVKLLRSGSV